MSMIKYPTSARNLIKAIKSNTVTNTVLHYKDEDKTVSITPESFMSDLEFYGESGIFADSIDFKYSKTDGRTIIVQAGNMSSYCNCTIAVSLQLNDGITRDDVEIQLREELFIQKSA